MSHSSGEVFKRGTTERIGYFEYNGTCDIGGTAVRATLDEVGEHWRSDDSMMRKCSCEAPVIVQVTMHSHYADGIDWPSVMCTSCMTVTGETDPSEANP